MTEINTIKLASASYRPRFGTSPFTAGTHFAQSAEVTSSLGSHQQKALIHTPRFGNISSTSLKQLSPLTQTAYKLFGPIWRNRGIELLVSDLIGFAALRTTMDLCREYMFKNTIHEKKQFNWPAARERLMMEIMGIMPDSLGLFAFAYGALSEKKSLLKGKQAFSNQFTDADTLSSFNKLLVNKTVKTPTEFIKQLAEHLSPEHAKQIEPYLQQAILKGGLKGSDIEKYSTKIAQILKQNHFEKSILGNTFSIETLLQDAAQFVKSSSAFGNRSANWSQKAGKLLANTVKINRSRIMGALALGIIFNFSAPYLIQKLTRKIEGINDYPGEQGLRELKTVDKKNDVKRGFLPYLRESLSNGNILPLAISLTPLPIIMGMIDTEKLASSGLKASWNGFKPGLNKFLSMMQFCKSFPYAGPQQMAMLYALVVFSRVAAARNGVEFRERVVDAFLGWSSWILMTPILKRIASKWFDKNHGTQLMKNVGGQLERKSEAEILNLIKNPKILQKTLSRYTWINVGAILGTITILGFIEPYLSIKITEWQSRWMSNRRKQYHERAQRYAQPA